MQERVRAQRNLVIGQLLLPCWLEAANRACGRQFVGKLYMSFRQVKMRHCLLLMGMRKRNYERNDKP